MALHALRCVQGRLVSGGVDELSPEPEERSGGSQTERPGMYRDGKDLAGSQKPCSRRGELSCTAKTGIEQSFKTLF